MSILLGNKDIRDAIKRLSKGGEGSGNFDHEGRPGEVGGSGDGGGGSTPSGDKPSGGDSGGGSSGGSSDNDGKTTWSGENSVGLQSKTRTDNRPGKKKERIRYTIAREKYEALPHPENYSLGDKVANWEGDGKPLSFGKVSEFNSDNEVIVDNLVKWDGSASGGVRPTRFITPQSALKVSLPPVLC